MIKIVWHDGIGMSLYAKRLAQGRFLWPSPADGIVAISAAQLAYMLDGIDWLKPGSHLASTGSRLILRPINSPYAQLPQFRFERR